jgi:hypothetical protein
MLDQLLNFIFLRTSLSKYIPKASNIIIIQFLVSWGKQMIFWNTLIARLLSILHSSNSRKTRFSLITCNANTEKHYSSIVVSTYIFKLLSWDNVRCITKLVVNVLGSSNQVHETVVLLFLWWFSHFDYFNINI